VLEKPDLPDEAIRTCLREYYGLRVTQLEFLPLGYDSRAGVYRVEAEYGGAYFLKVRRGPVNPACLALPYYLKMHGLPQVIAPLPAQGQVLWQRVGAMR
jgi:spectinomycin phosphotransferase